MILAFGVLITHTSNTVSRKEYIVKQSVFLILDLRFSCSVKAIALGHKIPSQRERLHHGCI